MVDFSGRDLGQQIFQSQSVSLTLKRSGVAPRPKAPTPRAGRCSGSFGLPFLQLLSSTSSQARPLDLEDSLQDAGLCTGDALTAIVRDLQGVATYGAFALWCSGGRALVWGDPDYGGDLGGLHCTF